MKSTKMLTIVVLALGLMVCSVQVSEAAPMGTAFTYQGRLIDANSAAEGLYDFQFKLFDDANTITGTQLGSPIDINDLDVIDGYFTVELDFGSAVFDGNAVWLETRVVESPLGSDPCTLSPRQEVTPTPYALQTRGIFVDNTLNVGIGTTTPEQKLTVVDGTIKCTNSSSGGWAVHGEASGWYGEGVYGYGTGYGGRGVYGKAGEDLGMGVYGKAIAEGQVTNYGGYFSAAGDWGLGVYGTATATGSVTNTGGFFSAAGDSGTGVYGRCDDGKGVYGVSTNGYAGYFTGGKNYFEGNVGIGTTSPGSRLEIKAASGSSAGGLRIISSTNNNKVIHIQDATPGDQGMISIRAGGSDKIVLRANGKSYFNGGDVGIGTTSPETKLHIDGGSDASLGGGGFLVTGSESGTNMVIDDNEIIARNNGNPSKLYLNKGSGNVVVSVLEIIGGSDLAEPFEVAGAESIKPGMVVAIDPEHPGQLRIADKAYDRTVAGIVSGANGINPGMTMSQEEIVADGSILVALTGRVYVWADASKGLIEPGDLLTTSETSGHAMKVTDYSKAHGAILGKAMSTLDQGQGLVLVLVTLQ